MPTEKAVATAPKSKFIQFDVRNGQDYAELQNALDGYLAQGYKVVTAAVLPLPTIKNIDGYAAVWNILLIQE